MARKGSTQLYDYDGNLALNSRRRQNSSIEYYQNKQYRHHSSYNLSENTNKGKISAYSNMLSKRAESVNREINFLKKKQERLQQEIDKLENGGNKEDAYVQEQIDELNAELQRVSKQIAEDAKTVISLGISAGTGGGASSDTSTQGGGSSASAGRANDAGGSSKSNNNASNSHTGVSNNPKRRKQIDSFLEKKEKLDKITSITGNPVGIVNAGISKTGRKVSKFGKDAEESASGNVNYDPQKHAQQFVQNTFKKLNDTRRQTNSAVVGIATLVGGPLGGLIAILVIIILTLLIGASLFFSIFSLAGGSTQGLSGLNNSSNYSYNSDNNNPGTDYSFNFSDIASTDKNTLAASYAVSKIGCPYDQNAHGKLNIDVFDCSSLCYRAYQNVGIDISNHGNYTTDGELRAAEQKGQIIDINDIQPGDLIFFWKSDSTYYKGVGHVEMYIGDGKVVHAKGVNYGVVLDDFYKQIKPTATRHVICVSRPY